MLQPHDASKLGGLAFPMLAKRAVGQLIPFTRGNLGFESTVPKAILVLVDPRAHFAYFLVREVAQLFRDLFYPAHNVLCSNISIAFAGS